MASLDTQGGRGEAFSVSQQVGNEVNMQRRLALLGTSACALILCFAGVQSRLAKASSSSGLKAEPAFVVLNW
jgi:hypothetical protein